MALTSLHAMAAELAPSLGNRQRTTVRVRICCHDQKLHRPGCANCGATKIHIRAERVRLWWEAKELAERGEFVKRLSRLGL